MSVTKYGAGLGLLIKYNIIRKYGGDMHDDLERIYEARYRRPAPTKIPAGRIELEMGDGIEFASTGLSLIDATAEMNFKNGTRAEVFVHANEAVGMIRIHDAPTGIAPKLKAPPFSGETTGGLRNSGPDPSDLALLGYPAPEEMGGEGWQAFTQQGAEGFHFAVYLGWRRDGSTWTGSGTHVRTASSGHGAFLGCPDYACL